MHGYRREHSSSHFLSSTHRISHSHITKHLPQHPPRDSGSSVLNFVVGPVGPLDVPEGYPDISLLYRRISRTVSKKAFSTLMRDFADVSMNLQLNFLATCSPSITMKVRTEMVAKVENLLGIFRTLP